MIKKTKNAKLWTSWQLIQCVEGICVTGWVFKKIITLIFKSPLLQLFILFLILHLIVSNSSHWADEFHILLPQFSPYWNTDVFMTVCKVPCFTTGSTVKEGLACHTSYAGESPGSVWRRKKERERCGQRRERGYEHRLSQFYGGNKEIKANTFLIQWIWVSCYSNEGSPLGLIMENLLPTL